MIPKFFVSACSTGMRQDLCSPDTNRTATLFEQSHCILHMQQKYRCPFGPTRLSEVPRQLRSPSVKQRNVADRDSLVEIYFLQPVDSHNPHLFGMASIHNHNKAWPNRITTSIRRISLTGTSSIDDDPERNLRRHWRPFLHKYSLPALKPTK